MAAPAGPTGFRVAGSAAVLATFGSLGDVLAFRDVLDRDPARGVDGVVTGARTLLLRFDPRATDRHRLEADLAARQVSAAVATHDTAPAGVTGDAIAAVEATVIPVVYDGDDLDEVGRLTGLGARGVIEAHTAQVWTSAFCGFAPGFSYLVGSNDPWAIPRRTTSRTRVPAGAVGLAGEFSAVYPRSSPGGWQLIGRTSTPMWSLDRQPPALAPPGARIRFVEADA